MELIHIKVFNQEKAYDVWIEEDCKVNDFIEDVIQLCLKNNMPMNISSITLMKKDLGFSF